MLNGSWSFPRPAIGWAGHLPGVRPSPPAERQTPSATDDRTPGGSETGTASARVTTCRHLPVLTPWRDVETYLLTDRRRDRCRGGPLASPGRRRIRGCRRTAPRRAAQGIGRAAQDLGRDERQEDHCQRGTRSPAGYGSSRRSPASRRAIRSSSGWTLASPWRSSSRCCNPTRPAIRTTSPGPRRSSPTPRRTRAPAGSRRTSRRASTSHLTPSAATRRNGRSPPSRSLLPRTRQRCRPRPRR